MANNPRWQNGQQSCEWTSEPPLRLGSTYDQSARFLGRDIVSSFEVVEFDPGRRIRIVTTSGTMPIDVTREVEPIGDDRCRVGATVKGDPPGSCACSAPSWTGWSSGACARTTSGSRSSSRAARLSGPTPASVVEQIQHDRRGPGELLTAVSRAVGGVVVLREPVAPDELEQPATSSSASLSRPYCRSPAIVTHLEHRPHGAAPVAAGQETGSSAGRLGTTAPAEPDASPWRRPRRAAVRPAPPTEPRPSTARPRPRSALVPARRRRGRGRRRGRARRPTAGRRSPRRYGRPAPKRSPSPSTESARSARARSDSTSRELNSTSCTRNGIAARTRAGSWSWRARHVDEVHVAVVFLGGGPLVGVRHLHVDAGVGRHLAIGEIDAGECGVPEGRVVHTRLPRVPDLDEAVAVGTLPVEEVVPGGELRHHLGDERRRLGVVAGVAQDRSHGEGVHRRAARSPTWPARREPRPSGQRARTPPREVVGAVGGEHDVGQHPVGPLAPEQRRQLAAGPGGAVTGVGHRHERGVPSSTDAGRARARARWRRRAGSPAAPRVPACAVPPGWGRGSAGPAPPPLSSVGSVTARGHPRALLRPVRLRHRRRRPGGVRRLRDEAPLYRNEKYDFWALSRYDDVLAGSSTSTPSGPGTAPSSR